MADAGLVSLQLQLVAVGERATPSLLGDAGQPPLQDEAVRHAMYERFGSDLAGLLNILPLATVRALLREGMRAMPWSHGTESPEPGNEAARGCARTRPGVPESATPVEGASSLPASERGDLGALRAALWRWGACYEAGCGRGPQGPHHVCGAIWQPCACQLGTQVVVHRTPRGSWPPAPRWPRPLPPERPPLLPDHEPESVDELLDNAAQLLGVRLGDRGTDKGAWGARAAELLGVVDHGHDEPDWRGDVEVKTVPVRADRHGRWRVVEDPAICMAPGRPLAKLARVLWLVRVTLVDAPALAAARRGLTASSATRWWHQRLDATVISWYFLEMDADLERLALRDLHQRPKGPKGTSGRGWYLHKRFFADCGLLATLNGTLHVD